jgi:hypothetical protein
MPLIPGVTTTFRQTCPHPQLTVRSYPLSPIPYSLSPNSVRVRSEKFKCCKPSMAETIFYNALRAAIDEEMARDSAVYIMGEDVGHYGGSYKVTKDLHKKYGDLRVLDTPIAENSFVGMAIGSAMTLIMRGCCVIPLVVILRFR